MNRTTLTIKGVAQKDGTWNPKLEGEFFPSLTMTLISNCSRGVYQSVRAEDWGNYSLV